MSDFSDAAKTEQRLRDANNKLHALVPRLAKARQIKEFASDRRRSLLANYAAPLLVSNGVAAAETIARSEPLYQDDLAEQETQFRDAEAVIAEWQATMCTFDAARSLLSMSRETMRQLQG